MKKMNTFMRRTGCRILSALVVIATVTAQVGVGTASSWGMFQQEMPEGVER